MFNHSSLSGNISQGNRNHGKVFVHTLLCDFGRRQSHTVNRQSADIWSSQTWWTHARIFPVIFIQKYNENQLRVGWLKEIGYYDAMFQWLTREAIKHGRFSLLTVLLDQGIPAGNQHILANKDGQGR